MSKQSQWWKEPMVWLILGLPLAAVIAGIATVVIAARNSDTLVQGEFQKEGLTLHQSTERTLRAAELGLSAALRLDGTALRVDLEGYLQPMPDHLTLRLAHPTQAGKDVTVTLARQGDRAYLSELTVDRATTSWQVLLEPLDQSWRLHGRWNPLLADPFKLVATAPASPTRP